MFCSLWELCFPDLSVTGRRKKDDAKATDLSYPIEEKGLETMEENASYAHENFGMFGIETFVFKSY